MRIQEEDKKYGIHTVMKDERMKKKLSLRELSKLLDVNYSSVQLWENKKRVPSEEYANRLEEFFGKPVGELQKNLSIPDNKEE